MKHVLAVLVAVGVLSLLGVVSVAQTLAGDAPAVVAPAAPTASDTTSHPASAVLPNVFYYLYGDSIVAAVRLSLTESRGSVGAGDLAANLLWSGGGKSWMTVAGQTSELQIAELQPRFGIVTDRVTALALRLGAFQVRKDTRWVQTELGRPREIFRKPVALEVREVKPNIWYLTPKEPLKPGEYCFASVLNGPVADFTIAGRMDKGK
jgi:hypothetical protein